MKKLITVFATSLFLLSACNNADQDTTAAPDEMKIISLNGTVSEILAGFDMEQNIVGVDVTSVYPESMKSKTQLGSAHNYNIESIIASQPDYVICTKERGLNPEQINQIEQSGINVWVIEQQFSVNGTTEMINLLADSFHKQDAAKELIAKMKADMAAIKASDAAPKVLFIYARGANTLQVAGAHTPMNELIKLANGTPAMGDAFHGFKPLTAEALIAANPDYILLFDTGMKSLEGVEGVLKIPGVSNTNAGKNKGIIEMDGLKLSGFGPRLGEAAKELSERIHPQS